MTPYAPGPQRPAPGPPSPSAPARPPAPPSTGLGWTIVALFSCWPFAVAALPHTRRSSRALGAGDTTMAAAEGAQARRLGIWGLVVGLVLSTLLTTAVMVAAINVMMPFLAAGAVAQSSGSLVDPGPGSGPEDGTPVRDLRDGACYDTGGLTEVVARVETVDCDQPHGGEMYYYTDLSADFRDFDDGYTPEFPGDTALAQHVESVCDEKLAALTGDADAFDVWSVAPDSWEWRSGITSGQCFAEARDGAGTGSIATRTSDN